MANNFRIMKDGIGAICAEDDDICQSGYWEEEYYDEMTGKVLDKKFEKTVRRSSFLGPFGKEISAR